MNSPKTEISCHVSLVTGIISCCNWDGCNGDASKATRSRTEYEKHLLDKNQKFEKFSLQASSDRNNKLSVLFERRSPTYFPTMSTSKPNGDLKPGRRFRVVRKKLLL